MTLGRCVSFCIVACAAAVLGCFGDDDTYVRRFPLLFEFMSWADTLAAGVPDSVTLGVLAGGRTCAVERLGVERRADSLVVSGTMRCVFHEGPQPGAAEITTAPEPPPHLQWLRLALPPLAAGTYTLAAGDLSDTLVVGARAAPAARDRIAAYGEVILSGSCWYFDTRSFSTRRYVLNEPPWPSTPLPYFVELHATEAQPAPCDTAVAGLRVRSPLRPTP